MYRFINYSKSITRSKKCRAIISKCLFCDLNASRPRHIAPLNNNSFNIVTHNKFCTQQDQSLEGNVSEEDIKLISNGDCDLEHKLRVIILEADVMRQDGKCVPAFSYMKHQHWKELLALQTRTARSKYLTYLFKIQMKVENKASRKEVQKLLRESEPKMEFPDDGKIRYHLGGNHMFLRIYESTMNNMYNNKLIQAIRFGQKLIIDCGFHNNMNARENSNCAKQLMLVFSDNRYHDDPFDLHFCNMQKDNRLHDILHKFIPPMYDADFPINVHEKSYLEMFPRDKLVYLTPHCREEMMHFDHDAFYIIGGIVDKMNNEPLTLAKAKQEGIRMAKLPLDRYLHWGSGSGKSLTINQVISILLDIKKSGDWTYALRHVPKRKIMQSDQMQERKLEQTNYPTATLSSSASSSSSSSPYSVSKQLIQAARRINNNNNNNNNMQSIPLDPHQSRSNARNETKRSYQHDDCDESADSTSGAYYMARRRHPPTFATSHGDHRMAKQVHNTLTSFRSNWKPQSARNQLKKEPAVIDVKSILEESEREP